MSYEKAMKHWVNPRKWKKTQPILCAGYGRHAVATPPKLAALLRINNWFKDRRHDKTPEERMHRRACIEEAISEYRSSFTP